MPKLMSEKYKEKLLSLGLVMPKDKEQDYCKENLLEVRRLENGCRIISAQRVISDTRSSSLNFQICSGSYSDPKGKEGIHHFLEHLLFDRGLHTLHDKNLVNGNANTSPLKVRFLIDGLFNTHYPDFGLMPVLEQSIKTLESPVGLNNEEYFERTKDVIYREIDEYQADAQRQTYKIFNEIMLHPDNSSLSNTLGTRESLSSITIEDVKKIADEKITSANMIISQLCIGNGKESKVLTDKISEIMLKFPKKGSLNGYDPFETDRINTLEPRTIVKRNVPIKNGMVAVIVTRFCEIEPYTVDYYAFKNYLAKHLRNEFFIESREVGLGYSVDLFAQTFLPNKAMVGFVCMCRTEDHEKVLQTLNDVANKVLDETENDKTKLAEILEIEKNRQIANPISQESKLEFALYYLNTLDLIGDVQAERMIKLQVQLDDIYNVLGKVKNTHTNTFIIGDIN